MHALLIGFVMLFAADPRPPREDIVYLLQAGNLIEVERQTATEQRKGSGKKEEITYMLAGEASPVRTPLASPVFLLLSKDVDADSLSLYKMDVRGGQREIVMSSKKRLKPIALSVTKQDGGVARIEVVDSLPKGEYVLTPAGSNLTFAFSVD